jgi:hypothetical protein
MPAMSSNLCCVGPSNQIGMDFRVILAIPLYITKKEVEPIIMLGICAKISS